MTQAENARVREFSQKMRDKGSAGFAAGPWDNAEAGGGSRLSARQRKQRNWGMKASRRARQRTFGDRVLTWMAILALITLIAGIAGAWLSYQPEPEITVTHPDRLNKTPGLARVESRLTRMEKRLSHILDPYIRRLNNLGSELDNTQEQLIGHIRNTEQQQATMATGFDERLENVEQQLAATRERMDALSTMLDTLAATRPESAPDTDQFYFRTAPATAGSPGTREATAIAEQDQAPAFTPEAESDATASWATNSPVMPGPATPESAVQQPVSAAPAESQTAAAPEPRPEPAARQIVSTAPVENLIAAAPEPVPEPTPEPAAQQPVAAAPTDSQTAAASEPVVETRPEPAAPVAAGPAAVTAQGNWAINIASYTNARIARRELAKMQRQGVDVELVTAEVNGKTIYRARVFGFASRRAATAASTGIQSKLGLEEIWITKR